jgi:predicted transcriptional regulator
LKGFRRGYRPPLEERQIITLLGLYGLSQRKIAAALEVSEPLVSMGLHGKRKASQEDLSKLRNLQHWVSYRKKINKIPPELQ